MQAIADDLMALRRDVALRALGHAGAAPVAGALDRFLAARAEAVERLDRLIGTLAAQEGASLAALTVALRQVRSVVG
jgi:NAD-specific glutamate dehydrogenase